MHTRMKSGTIARNRIYRTGDSHSLDNEEFHLV
jgi:hypothetical protein